MQTLETSPVGAPAIGTTAPASRAQTRHRPPHLRPVANLPTPASNLSNMVQSHVERILTVVSECDMATAETLTLAHEAHEAFALMLASLSETRA